MGEAAFLSRFRPISIGILKITEEFSENVAGVHALNIRDVTTTFWPGSLGVPTTIVAGLAGMFGNSLDECGAVFTVNRGGQGAAGPVIHYVPMWTPRPVQYTIDASSQTVQVLDISHRRDAYH